MSTDSALAIQYGKQVPWVSPSYESATVSTAGETVYVTVTLANATALQTTTPFNVPQCARQACATLLEFGLRKTIRFELITARID